MPSNLQLQYQNKTLIIKWDLGILIPYLQTPPSMEGFAKLRFTELLSKEIKT